jgi:hypothetical protein
MALMVVITLVQIAFLAMPTEIRRAVQWPRWLTVGILILSASLLGSTAVRYSRLKVDIDTAVAPVDKEASDSTHLGLEVPLGDTTVVAGCAFDRSGCLGR